MTGRGRADRLCLSLWRRPSLSDVSGTRRGRRCGRPVWPNWSAGQRCGRPVPIPAKPSPLDPPADPLLAAMRSCPARRSARRSMRGSSSVEVKANVPTSEPPRSVELWARLDSSDGYNVLIAQSVKESPEHWELFTQAGNGQLAAFLPGYAPDHVRSASPIVDGRWHYLAMTFDGEQLKLYVDGKAVGRAGLKSPGRGRRAGTTWIGGYPPGPLGCQGTIDEVRLSSRPAITSRTCLPVPFGRRADRRPVALRRREGRPLPRRLTRCTRRPGPPGQAVGRQDHFFGWKEVDGRRRSLATDRHGTVFLGHDSQRNSDDQTKRLRFASARTSRPPGCSIPTCCVSFAPGRASFSQFSPRRFGLSAMLKSWREPSAFARRQCPAGRRWTALTIRGSRSRWGHCRASGPITADSIAMATA